MWLRSGRASNKTRLAREIDRAARHAVMFVENV